MSVRWDASAQKMGAVARRGRIDAARLRCEREPHVKESDKSWGELMLNRRAFQIALGGGLWLSSPAKAQTPDVDPTRNVVVFDIAGREPYDASGPTRADDCIQQIWASAPAAIRSAAARVRRVYSEWEPSRADTQFIESTFPGVYLTWSFDRPAPDGWDAAFAAARIELERAMSARH